LLGSNLQPKILENKKTQVIRVDKKLVKPKINVSMLLNPKKSDKKVTASALQSNEHLIIKNHAATTPTHRSLGKGTD
jgi:hypothetical protein